jgi:hypothetical protein
MIYRAVILQICLVRFKILEWQQQNEILYRFERNVSATGIVDENHRDALHVEVGTVSSCG